MFFVNPEYVVVLYNVNNLKDLLTDKIVEKDYLINYYCKNLKIDYMLKIGALEYKKLLAQNRVKKLKRKIELINSLEFFREEEVDELLKKEFEKNSKLEKEMFLDVNMAIEYSLKDNLTDDEIEDLNVTYSVIVRSWNPILNTELSDRKIRLYKEAEKAYSEGNIKLLESYANIIDEDEIIEQGEIKYLKEKEKKYQKLLGEAEEVLKIIKNSFPYTEKDVLTEERETRKRKDKINKDVQELEEEIKMLEKDLLKRLKGKK